MHGLQKFALVGRRSWFDKTSGGRCPSFVVPAGCAVDCQNNGALDGEEMERHALPPHCRVYELWGRSSRFRVGSGGDAALMLSFTRST